MSQRRRGLFSPREAPAVGGLFGSPDQTRPAEFVGSKKYDGEVRHWNLYNRNIDPLYDHVLGINRRQTANIDEFPNASLNVRDNCHYETSNMGQSRQAMDAPPRRRGVPQTPPPAYARRPTDDSFIQRSPDAFPEAPPQRSHSNAAYRPAPPAPRGAAGSPRGRRDDYDHPAAPHSYRPRPDEAPYGCDDDGDGGAYPLPGLTVPIRRVPPPPSTMQVQNYGHPASQGRYPTGYDDDEDEDDGAYQHQGHDGYQTGGGRPDDQPPHPHTQRGHDRPLGGSARVVPRSYAEPSRDALRGGFAEEDDRHRRTHSVPAGHQQRSEDAYPAPPRTPQPGRGGDGRLHASMSATAAEQRAHIEAQRSRETFPPHTVTSPTPAVQAGRARAAPGGVLWFANAGDNPQTRSASAGVGGRRRMSPRRPADEDAFKASQLLSTGNTGMRPQPDVDVKGDGRAWTWKRGNPNATKSSLTFMAGGLHDGHGGGGLINEASPSRKRPSWLAQGTRTAQAAGSPTHFRNSNNAPGL